jgi:26S proteasome regulatory subunit N2
MGTMAQSSASNYLALLDEDDDALKLFALQSLNKVVHDFWFQIASSIAAVEAFYEDEDFSNRELAALVASKVGYEDIIWVKVVWLGQLY